MGIRGSELGHQVAYVKGVVPEGGARTSSQEDWVRFWEWKGKGS